MHGWLSELNKSMNQWISESMNQRINEAINQNQSINRWIIESILYINETMNNQRIKAPMNQWLNKWTNEWIEGWMAGWMGGWMGGWMDEWATFSFLSYFFTEQPLRWGASSPTATSSLSSHLSGLLLLWAVFFSIGSATEFFSSPSWYIPFSNLVAVRSRTAAVAMRIATTSCNPACQERRSITHALLRAAVPVRFVTAGCRPA